MNQTRPSPSLRRRLISPPPPGTSTTQLHWALYLLRSFALSSLSAVGEVYHATSTFHRVLVSQLLLTIVAVELMRSVEADPLLSTILGMVKVGLVGDCIFSVVHQLRRRSSSRALLETVLCEAPLLTGSSTELVLTILFIRDETASAAEEFLIGTIYAKLLVIGAMCLVSHGLYLSSSDVTVWPEAWSDVLHLLIIGGILVFASAPQIQSRSVPSICHFTDQRP